MLKLIKNYRYLKNNYHVVLYKQLTKFHQNLRREYDETEAYLRHRQRVHEREKREKLKKQGKLDEYLKEKAVKEPEPAPIVITWEPDQLIENYKAAKKLDEENSVLINYSKIEVDEKKVEIIVKQIKKKKKNIQRAKKARVEEEKDCEMEEPAEFNPRMAGRTGLPLFFFNNLVKQNRSAFQKAEARNRMLYKIFPPKC